MQEYARTIHKAYFFQAGTGYPYPVSPKRVVKGIDGQGHEFLSYEGSSCGWTSDNSWHTGMVHLIKSGGQVAAFMLELKPVNRDRSSAPSNLSLNFLYDCVALRTIWNKFIASVKFGDADKKMVVAPEDLEGTWQCRIVLGSAIWGYTSSLPLRKYHFADDGRWQSEKMITESNYGKYHVDGDRLLITDGAGKNTVYKFRLERVFEYNAWTRYLTLYDINGTETRLTYIGD